MLRETRLEIDARNLDKNLEVFRKLIRPGTKILANLKGNAYGMGAPLIGKYLEEKNIDYFSVAYLNEGIALRKSGIKAKILVFNPALFHFEALITYKLEPEVSSLHYLEKLISFLREKRIKNFPVHIKFDTGMHRAGIEMDEIYKLIEILKKSPEIKLQSIFSHLAAAEDPAKDAFTWNQFKSFDKIIELLQTHIPYSFFKHILNTAGVFRFPEKQYDMIRPGLGIFGYNLVEKNQKDLYPIGVLKTAINQIKTLKKGESAGYNQKFIAPKDHTKIALLPIGYADGFPRKAGNGKWKVSLGGKRVPVIGNVSMDTISIDVTGISCNPGDEVVIYDNKDDIYKMARLLQSIPYEVTSSVTARVERILKP